MASPPDKSPVWITPDPHLARFQSNQMKESDIENDSDYKFLGRLKKKNIVLFACSPGTFFFVVNRVGFFWRLEWSCLLGQGWKIVLKNCTLLHSSREDILVACSSGALFNLHLLFSSELNYWARTRSVCLVNWLEAPCAHRPAVANK